MSTISELESRLRRTGKTVKTALLLILNPQTQMVLQLFHSSNPENGITFTAAFSFQYIVKTMLKQRCGLWKNLRT